MSFSTEIVYNIVQGSLDNKEYFERYWDCPPLKAAVLYCAWNPKGEEIFIFKDLYNDKWDGYALKLNTHIFEVPGPHKLDDMLKYEFGTAITGEPVIFIKPLYEED